MDRLRTASIIALVLASFISVIAQHQPSGEKFEFKAQQKVYLVCISPQGQSLKPTLKGDKKYFRKLGIFTPVEDIKDADFVFLLIIDDHGAANHVDETAMILRPADFVLDPPEFRAAAEKAVWTKDAHWKASGFNVDFPILSLRLIEQLHEHAGLLPPGVRRH